MRNAITFCLLLLCASTAAFGQLYNWTFITPEQAIQTVRDFEGDQHLEVTVVSGPQGRFPDDLWLGLYRYVLATERYEYVCSQGRMDRSDRLFRGDWAEFYDGEMDNEVLKARMLPESDTESIATAFMNSRYPEPSVLTDVNVHTAQHHGAFSPCRVYTFYQCHPANLTIPCICEVSVDTVFGRVVKYVADHFPLLIDVQPLLTPEEAAASAVGIMRMTDATLVKASPLFVYPPDPWGLERLILRLHIIGTAPYDAADWVNLVVLPTWQYPEKKLKPEDMIGEKESYRYAVYVDAHDGSVVYWDELLALSDGKGTPIKPAVRKRYPCLSTKLDGATVPLSSPPILIEERVFIGARYLCQGDSAARLVRKDTNTFALTRDGKEFIFALNSSEYTADGKRRRLPARPQIVNDRLFLPAEVLTDVLGYKIRYDSAGKTLHMESSHSHEPGKTSDRKK
jgi:hypothetical protein